MNTIITIFLNKQKLDLEINYENHYVNQSTSIELVRMAYI